MADSRTIVTGASIAAALLCATWAIYASKHAPAAGGFNPGARPQGATASAGQGGGAGNATVVVMATAQRQRINVGIEAIGTANSNEAVSVTSKTSNIVTAIHFTDGQTVQSGQILVELDRAQTSADLGAATADYKESLSQFNRSRELVSIAALSKAQSEQLESTMKANEAKVAAAQARLTDTYIRAPFSGRVGLRRVSLGTLISPGTVITTLDDISSIKVDFQVPDMNLAALHPGQSVVTHTSAYPGRDFAGKVLSIDSRIDPATRAVTVRALLPNRDGALKPGMFLTVDLAKEQRSALMVPEESLVPEQARMFVYVQKGDAVIKREVRLGRREVGRVEITEGLSEGDRIVTEGSIKLRDGAKVRELVAAPAGAAPAVNAAAASEGT
jgi:membrane fusion protein, multidrug efflux system